MSRMILAFWGIKLYIMINLIGYSYSLYEYPIEYEKEMVKIRKE